MADPIQSPVRIGIDLTAATAVFATLMEWVPKISAVLGLLWFAIQIWESKTVRDWWDRYLVAHRARKLKKLQARQKIIEAKIVAVEKIRRAKVVANEVVEKAKTQVALDKASDQVTKIASESD